MDNREETKSGVNRGVSRIMKKSERDCKIESGSESGQVRVESDC